MADGIILIIGLVILAVMFVVAYWLVARINTLHRNISPEDIDILNKIKTKLSEIVYITGDSEFATILLMLDGFIDKYYPSSGIVRPFETWMILARRYYNEMRIIPMSGLDELDGIEDVVSILREVLHLASKLQSIEVYPVRGHIWLCCLMRILQLERLL